MKKTRSLIGKMLAAVLILFVLSAPFMSATFATYNPLALPSTSAFFTPFRVQGNIGATVVVYANVTNVVDLLTVQLGLTWSNTTAVECTDVTNGSWWNGAPTNKHGSIPGDINNTAGEVYAYLYSVLGQTYAFTGSATLMKITFHMLQTGYADLHVKNMLLIYKDGVTAIPSNTIDYFTTIPIPGGNQYIVKIKGNPMQGSGMNGGFSAQKFAIINTIINSKTYHGNVSFSVTADTGGSGGSFAYFNVTIPQSLMNCSNPDDWIVRLNGAIQAARIVFSNATHSTLSLEFTYSDSQPTQTVQILGTEAVPEFSSIFLATLLVLASLAAALFGKITWSNKRKG